MHSTRRDVAGLVWKLSAYTDLIKTDLESSDHTTALTFAGSYRRCRKNIHCQWPSWQAWNKPIGKFCDIGSYPLSICERVIPDKSWIFIFKRFFMIIMHYFHARVCGHVLQCSKSEWGDIALENAKFEQCQWKQNTDLPEEIRCSLPLC